MAPFFRQDSPPVMSLDLNESKDFTLTGSNSSEESDLKNTCCLIWNSTQDKCTTWTDEKHNLYLSHLESSFIEQLHYSKGFSRRQSQQETEGTKVSRHLSANEQHASEKLTVLQDGSWKKIELNCPIMKSEHHVLESPWGQQSSHAGKRTSRLQKHNLVSSGEKRLGRKRIFSNESATGSDQITVSLGAQESVGCLEEFSDQNFAEDVPGKSSTFMSKRSKPAVATDESSHEQIVPEGKSYRTMSAPEEKAHQKVLVS